MAHHSSHRKHEVGRRRHRHQGGIDADTRFLDCLGYAGESRDLRQLTGGNVWNDDKGMYVHDPLTAEEILGEATRISFPLSSILFIEKVD